MSDPPTIEEKTSGMTALEGFFDLYWDERSGRLFWEIDRFEEEFLHVVSLTSGLGSNPVGLDRGQLGGTWILKARRVGPKILLIQPNYRYRARSDNPREVEAVAFAFAPSTQWGFDITAQSGERVLVDATDFFLRDVHGAGAAMQGSGQGSFRLDRSRSVFHLPRTKAFPKNCEVETWLTFTSDDPGRLVSSTAADGGAVSLIQHHSLVELPDDGYTPRRADPRVSAGSITFSDYATPIDEDLQIHWVTRFRLQKKDPSARRSEAVKPIVFYVDPGAPEPIYSALKEGAAWWNEAFEAAGFIDAFQVRDLPEDADPMDLRYNMIHWTHRSTRGWSYGGSVTDPRTGEILKGNVNLGSLRLRQDVLLGEGLLPVYGSAGGYGSGELIPELRQTALMDLADGPAFAYLAILDPQSDPVEMAMSRVRQLSCHEVGHTLGFAHNYLTSAYGRMSVMDYPAPLVNMRSDGTLDLSDAYPVGVGEYDIHAVTWTYSDFGPDADEEAELEMIIRDSLRKGIRFAADEEARPLGAAHPKAALWDNGADPVSYLRHELAVRQTGLISFGERNIRVGEPLAALEEVLVPLYFHHRYQMESAAHSLGGADYTYALRGDGQVPLEIVPADKQREALDLILATLEPRFLALPEETLNLIPPRAFGMTSGEVFASRTAPTLDPLGMAATSADFSVQVILEPARMARLVEFHSRNAWYPGLKEVVDQLLQATWYMQRSDNSYHAAIQEEVQQVVLDRMKREASNPACSPLVRAVLNEGVHELREWLSSRPDTTPLQAMALEDIQRWIDRPESLVVPGLVPAMPPGSPIGIPPARVIPPVS
ncbi:zinc-dependent metalloprotease [Candidatus Zixiibacteriota bacterium]